MGCERKWGALQSVRTVTLGYRSCRRSPRCSAGRASLPCHCGFLQGDKGRPWTLLTPDTMSPPPSGGGEVGTWVPWDESPCFPSCARFATSSRQSEGNQPTRPLTWPSQKPPSPMLSTGKGAGHERFGTSVPPRPQHTGHSPVPDSRSRHRERTAQGCPDTERPRKGQRGAGHEQTMALLHSSFPDPVGSSRGPGGKRAKSCDVVLTG